MPCPPGRVLRNALTYVRAFEDVVLAEHCEDDSLAADGQMHEGEHSYALGLAGKPRESEEVLVARDIAIARLTGGRLHLLHLSSAGSVELVRRAKAEGLRVTAEVTPHHLVFTDADLVTYDTNFKVNPPLRTAEDRDALRAALADGTIDVVGTDHAPHAVEEKEVEFDQAPPGTIGLETALAAVLTHLVGAGHHRRCPERSRCSRPRRRGCSGRGARRADRAGSTRRTWSCSIPLPSGWSNRRSPPEPQLGVHRDARCGGGSSTRSTGASSSSPTARRSDERSDASDGQRRAVGHRRASAPRGPHVTPKGRA